MARDESTAVGFELLQHLGYQKPRRLLMFLLFLSLGVYVRSPQAFSGRAGKPDVMMERVPVGPMESQSYRVQS